MENNMQLSDLDKYILYRWAYSVGEEMVSNAEYNLLEASIKERYPKSPYVHRSWSSDPCPVGILKQVNREDLIAKVILSDRTESIPSLNSDLRLEEELGNCYGEATVSMKHDGWNVQANYYNGELVTINTRGRSTDVTDVSGLYTHMPERIPVMGKVRVVHELTVSKENFTHVRRMFNNVSCRSAVSSLLARPDMYKYLDCTALAIHGYKLNGRCKFEVLKDWGFSVPDYRKVYNYADVLAAIADLSDIEPTYPHPTDGTVYDGQYTWAIRLGAWEEPIYQSYVIGYEEKFGPYRISPSVVIRDIKRKGSTQHQVSLTNWQRIMDYNLRPGAPIAFRIASDATADFDEESTKILHSQYENKWEEFKGIVDKNEAIKECHEITMTTPY